MVKVRQTDAVRGGWIEYGTIAVDAPSLAAGAEGNADVTITGIDTTDLVFVQAPSTLAADLFVKGASVTATDTVRIVLGNEGAGVVDGASVDFSYMIVHVV